MTAATLRALRSETRGGSGEFRLCDVPVTMSHSKTRPVRGHRGYRRGSPDIIAASRTGRGPVKTPHATRDG